jgi:predicted esterase YcpF (UPF0227 family)
MDNKYSVRRFSKYKDESKKRLSSIMKKKIQTTMIGAISSIEEHFAFLLEGNDEDSKKMQEVFQKIRSEILDKGNHQLRNVDVELSQYDIEWLRYSIQMPVKNIGDQK